MRLLPSITVLSLLLLAVSSGCATSAPNVIDRWAARQGGVSDNGRFAVASDALLAVQRPASGCQPSHVQLSIEVLNTDRPVAYAWPCGRIFVSEGLIDLLTREELIAAIAHEIGHLHADPAPETGVALSGGGHGDACEVAADRAGRELLRRSGLPERALVTMLNKVAASPHTSPAFRPRLERRAILLSSY